ncbi:MAG TPA: hypothetical protein VHM30_07280 [Gemmatimonadaceae bacterium]|nr:hypothetical protein [Gemmatimonadaceae bacterium]
MSDATRLRILIIALGAAAIAWAIVWEAPQPAEPRSNAAPYTPEPVAREVAAPAPARSESSPRLSPEEYAATLSQFGIVVMERERPGAGAFVDTGSFYFVGLLDSTRSLAELGFVRAGSLLDTSSRLVGYGDHGALPGLAVSGREAVDARLRERGDGCILEVATPLASTTESDEPWQIALADGSVQAPVARTRGGVGPSPATVAEALRLAAGPPFDTLVPRNRDERIFDKVPLTLVSHQRLTVGGVDIIVAAAKRDVEHEFVADGERHVVLREEQRSYIAERDGSGAYRIVWHHYDYGDPEYSTPSTPKLVLLLGRERLLTVYTYDEYVEGRGGTFVSRIAPGVWRPVVSWMAGC